MAAPWFVPDWLWHVGEVGGGIISGGVGGRFLDLWLGRKRTSAETRKTDAETTKTLSDIVDDRLHILLDSMRSQIEWQQKQIDRLTKQVADQDDHIQRQEDEIIMLRKALDERPRPQHQFGL